MRNFENTFETRKWSLISAFSIYITVPLMIDLDDFFILLWFYSKPSQPVKFSQ